MYVMQRSNDSPAAILIYVFNLCLFCSLAEFL